MKALYVAAWLMIIGFLAWSGNVLVSIQDLWSEMGELQHWRGQTEDLASAWRDLGRPGNDVLENYLIETQQAAFDTYLQRFNEARAYLGNGAFAWPELRANVRQRCQRRHGNGRWNVRPPCSAPRSTAWAWVCASAATWSRAKGSAVGRAPCARRALSFRGDVRVMTPMARPFWRRAPRTARAGWC
jgi:hypothetical protein